jgi:hypothetical protein
MFSSWLFASAEERRTAAENAYYAARDHRESAESYLRSKLKRARKRKTRRIYRLAVLRLRKTAKSAGGAYRRPAMPDSVDRIAADAFSVIAKAARQMDEMAAGLGVSAHDHIVATVGRQLREAEAGLRARIRTLAVHRRHIEP